MKKEMEGKRKNKGSKKKELSKRKKRLLKKNLCNVDKKKQSRKVEIFPIEHNSLYPQILLLLQDIPINVNE
jgi:hypothetical protein